MRFERVRGGLVAGVLCLWATATIASDTGQLIADQVQVSSYHGFLYDELFTHDGDDRGWGGADHDAARDNILAIFQGFGLAAELHHFDDSGFAGHNVVATQWGSAFPDAQYIIGAHYDSVGNPGADDDASGVAAMLEVARVLSQYETEYTIRYIAFDMEEWGLIGSGAYVDEHRDDDIRGMIQMEMMAFDTGQRRGAMYGGAASDPLKNALADAFAEYANDLTVHVYGAFDASDHAPFEWAGFRACAVSEYDWMLNPCYHQSCDSVDQPDYIDEDFAADFARSVAGFLADHAVAVTEPCEGDLDGDRIIGLSDLAILLGNYDRTSGMAYEDCDLDGDGDVDLADLAILLAVYGTDCP